MGISLPPSVVRGVQVRTPHFFKTLRDKTNSTMFTILRKLFKKENVESGKKKGGTLFQKLITSNSGISSKSFFLVIVTIIGCLLLIVPAFTLVVEVIFTHTIATDLSGMAAYIGAVAALFASAGITKAWSERYEDCNCKKSKKTKTSDNETSDTGNQNE